MKTPVPIGTLALLMLLAVYAAATPVASASPLLLAATTGGDCTAVGDWDFTEKTCTLTTPVSNSIQVGEDGITLDCNGNSIASSGLYGVLLATHAFQPVHGVTVRNCDISGFDYGLFSFGGSHNRIDSNIIHHNNFDGVSLDSETAALLESNTIRENGRHAANVLHGSGCNISANTFRDHHSGTALFVRSTSGASIRDNALTDNAWGLRVYSSNSSTISGNLLTGNGFEAMPGGFAANLALAVVGSSAITLVGNTMQGNSAGLAIARGYDHDIDASNTVNGNSVYYLRELSDARIDPTSHPNAAAVYCVGCSDVVIEDFYLDSANGQGVVLAHSSGSTVTGVTSTNNGYGVHLEESVDNVIEKNRLLNEFEDVFSVPIYAVGVSRNSFAGNQIDGRGASFNGIVIYPSFTATGDSDDNRVIDNSIKGINFAAIAIQGGSRNLVAGNRIRRSGTGVRVKGGGSAAWRDNTVANNRIRNGTLSVSARKGVLNGNDDGITVIGAQNTIIFGNRISGIKSNGLNLAQAPTTVVFQNDIFGNAETGVDAVGPTYQVRSVDKLWSGSPGAVAIELSHEGVGNYWGRNCGLGRKRTGDLFRPGVDSNGTEVVDSHSYRHSVAHIPADVLGPADAYPGR